MTDFVNCADCAALTLDDDDEIVKHRLWHADWDKKFRNTRSAAVEARDALGGLRADVKRYGEQLASRPIPAEPDHVNVRQMPSDEELGIPTSDDEDEDPFQTEDDVDQDDLDDDYEDPTPGTSSSLQITTGLS